MSMASYSGHNMASMTMFYSLEQNQWESQMKSQMLKIILLAFVSLFLHSQCMSQTDSYFTYLLCEEPFLHFTVEMTKTNDCWPTIIFIAVGKQLFFFFFKFKRKELVDFKILYCASPFSQI